MSEIRAVASSRRDLQRASYLIGGVVVALSRRRPKNFAAHEADGALEQLRLAQVYLQRADVYYEKAGHVGIDGDASSGDGR